MFLASIPSPSFNSFDVGPLTVRIYGLAIAAGVLTAVWLARRRYEKAGGDPEFLDRVAIWVVLAGIVGARVGFVLPRIDRFSDDPVKMFEVWEGGLTFFGGLLGGGLAGLILVVRNHARLGMLLTAVAPAIPLAQAIGRLGNYFNQELYGKPTDLPWGLEIDPEYRQPSGQTGYEQYETFHPTFLYEIIWNLALVGLLLWLGARKKLRPGSLALVYLTGYGVGRFLTELIRIDTEARILGLSRNAYNSILIAVLGAALLWWREGRKGGPEDTYLEDEDGSGDDSDQAEDAEADGSGTAASDEDAEEAGKSAGKAGKSDVGKAAKAGKAGKAEKAEKSDVGKAGKAEKAEADTDDTSDGDEGADEPEKVGPAEGDKSDEPGKVGTAEAPTAGAEKSTKGGKSAKPEKAGKTATKTSGKSEKAGAGKAEAPEAAEASDEPVQAEDTDRSDAGDAEEADESESSEETKTS